MSDNAPFPDLQSAHRKYHVTETALLKIQSDIIFNMGNKKVTMLVLLYLSAAFDAFAHCIMLTTLEITWALKALYWIGIDLI